MTIVTSVIISDDVQADGRRDIRERHTDDLGDIYPAHYLGEANTDANAVMLARVPFIEAQIEEVLIEATRRANKESALVKTNDYFDGQTDEELKRDFGYTDGELVEVRARGQ